MNDGTNWGILFLRFTIGIIFLYHAKQKFAMWNMKPSEQMPASMLRLMKFLAIVETLGGIAMVVGFLTQFAVVGLGIIMLGAINMKRSKMSLGFAEQQGTGWEFDFMILGGLVLLFFTGAGSIALDRILFDI